jgi:lipid-A-disaccharide synthase-like uncharacterized protein
MDGIEIDKKNLKILHYASLFWSLFGGLMGYIVALENNQNIFVNILIGAVFGYIMIFIVISKRSGGNIHIKK